MIRYSLQCSQGHQHDEWFSNSADYDAKKAADELTCPECGDKNVGKAIMAPSVGKSAAAPAPSCAMGPPGGGCGGCAFAGQH